MRTYTVIAILASAFLVAAGAQANSSGAPTAADNAGCTCHNPTPSAAITVAVEGLPDAFEEAMTYNLTLTVSGGISPPGASNIAGFLFLVDGGILAPTDGSVQATSETRLTHTSAGNDQTSWSFTWEAPLAVEDAANVTAWWAGNAVNGDGTSVGNLDNWNMDSVVIPNAREPVVDDMGPDNETAAPETPGSGIVAFVLAGLVALVLARPRD